MHENPKVARTTVYFVYFRHLSIYLLLLIVSLTRICAASPNRNSDDSLVSPRPW